MGRKPSASHCPLAVLFIAPSTIWTTPACRQQPEAAGQCLLQFLLAAAEVMLAFQGARYGGHVSHQINSNGSHICDLEAAASPSNPQVQTGTHRSSHLQCSIVAHLVEHGVKPLVQDSPAYAVAPQLLSGGHHSQLAGIPLYSEVSHKNQLPLQGHLLWSEMAELYCEVREAQQHRLLPGGSQQPSLS